MKKKWLWVVSCLIMMFGLNILSVSAGNEPVIIGLPTSLGYLEGQESRNAAEMAIKEINTKGGVNVGGQMRPFKLVATDTRDSEPGIPVSDALMAYEKLILQHKPHAIMTGFFTSEATLASMDITSKHKLPYIATIAMSPKFQQKIIENYDAYKYCFRMSFDAPYFVTAYLGLLKSINADFGFKRAFIFTEEALWAKASGEMVAKWLEGQGWEVAGHETFPKGASDFSATLLKIRNTKTQVIILINSGPESVIFADLWRTMRIPALLTGVVTAFCGEDAWKTYKGKVNGVVNIVESGVFPVKSIPASEVFYKAYNDFAKRPPGSSHGPGATYDAVYVLKDAIERAGSLDPDKIVAELEKTDRRGAIGRIRFGKGHQVVFGENPDEKAIILNFQWQEPGKRVAVHPPAVATGKIQFPKWMKKK